MEAWLKFLCYYSAWFTGVSSAPKASWVVVMYTMNNHTYNAMRVCDNRPYKALYLSSLGAKDTTQSLWETLVSLLKKCCCLKKCCGRVGCAVSSCGVKFQEDLSGLERERLKHWRYTCTFVTFLNITLLYFFSFHLWCISMV